MMIRWIRHFVSTRLRSPDLVRARRGQAIIMFALMAVPMIGMLGLVVDSGVYLYARRTAQAAADAAALAGARQLSKPSTEWNQPLTDEVEDLVTTNGQGGVVPAVQNCLYVDEDGDPIGPSATCDTSPDGASGVRVLTQVTVPTFFINIIPSAPSSATATGSATALVQRAGDIVADAPFIVCGIDAVVTETGDEVDIIENSNPLRINPAAVNQTFNIHGPQVASCGLDMNGFKGLLADTVKKDTDNAERPVPGPLVFDTGVEAGPTGEKVSGPNGCAAGAEPPYTCVMLLPLATDSPPPDKNSKEFYAVGFAAFEVASPKKNEHKAKLLSAYIIPKPGKDESAEDAWRHGDGGVVTVRLAG